PASVQLRNLGSDEQAVLRHGVALTQRDPPGVGKAPSACEQAIAIPRGAHVAQQIENAGPLGATERATRFQQAADQESRERPGRAAEMGGGYVEGHSEP